MGFGEQAQAGDAAGARKLMPLRFADGAQFHLSDDFVEERAQREALERELAALRARLADEST